MNRYRIEFKVRRADGTYFEHASIEHAYSAADALVQFGVNIRAIMSLVPEAISIIKLTPDAPDTLQEVQQT